MPVLRPQRPTTAEQVLMALGGDSSKPMWEVALLSPQCTDGMGAEKGELPMFRVMQGVCGGTGSRPSSGVCPAASVCALASE